MHSRIHAATDAAFCAGGIRDESRAFGNSSRNACADDAECDASSPDMMKAGSCMASSSSPLAPEGMVSLNRLSRDCAISAR